MARIRSIKPEFFTNEELAQSGPLGMLLFEGLWPQADREGRLGDRPARLKVLILPYFDCDVDSLLAQLQDLGFIRRYAVDGSKYIQIINFKKHQRPHPKEPASAIPEPTVEKNGRTRTKTAGRVSKNQNEPSSTPAPDPDPDPDLAPDPDLPEPKPFDGFWAEYPRKEAKQAARDAWAKLLPGDIDAIARDLPKRKEANWAGIERRSIPHPATYLNQRRWEDDLFNSRNVTPAPRQPRLVPGNQRLADLYTEASENERNGSDQNSNQGQAQLESAAGGRVDSR